MIFLEVIHLPYDRYFVHHTMSPKDKDAAVAGTLFLCIAKNATIDMALSSCVCIAKGECIFINLQLGEIENYLPKDMLDISAL